MLPVVITRLVQKGNSKRKYPPVIYLRMSDGYFHLWSGLFSKGFIFDILSNQDCQSLFETLRFRFFFCISPGAFLNLLFVTAFYYFKHSNNFLTLNVLIVSWFFSACYIEAMIVKICKQASCNERMLC